MLSKNKQKNQSKKGYTLIETLIALAILTILAVSIFSIITMGVKITSDAKARITAVAIANERIEMVRNLPYNDIGLMNGVPEGTLPAAETETLNGVSYTIEYDIRYIDDPYDGTLPADTVPTDYKKIRISVTWNGQLPSEPVIVITDISPQGMESATSGGTLWTQVFNSSTEPVAQADIQITNNLVSPVISIKGKTDNNGNYILPGAPASNNAYEITVTKNGYSSEQTYGVDPELNPNPSPEHLTVNEGSVTTKTFFIDPTSTLTIHSYDSSAIDTSWWDTNYSYRTGMNIQNTGTDAYETGYPISINLNHKGLVDNGKSLASGNDIRILYYNNESWKEIDRIITTTWNSEATTVWFPLQGSIDAGGSSQDYYIYYGNAEGINPLSDITAIFPPSVNENTIAWWGFENTGQIILTDELNTIPDGTITNIDPNTDWVSSRFGKALSLTNDGCIEIPDNEQLDITSSLTLEGWFYPQNSNEVQTLLEKYNNVSGQPTLKIQIVPNEGYVTLAASVETDQEFIELASATPLALDHWQHVALSINTATQTAALYVNNTQEDLNIFSGTGLKTNNGNLFIGCKDTSHEFFTGKLDAFALHTDARDSFPFTNTDVEPSVSQEGEQTQNTGNPLGNTTFQLTGTKTIGADGEGRSIYKYQATSSTDENGALTLSSMEYDTYTIAAPQPSSYVIAATNPPSPFLLLSGETKNVDITLAPYAEHTLLVTVKNANKEILNNVQVQVLEETTGYNVIKQTGISGQAFFSPLQALNYTINVSDENYQSETVTLTPTGQINLEILLAPL